MKLVIGNKNYSSWSLRPWLLLVESRIHFEEIQESLGQDNVRRRLAQYSPSCKVPVLIDDGITIWDSLAICEYVSEKYLDGAGWPHDRDARALARSVSAEMHSSFTAMRSELPMNCRARRRVTFSDAVRRDIQRVTEIWNDCLDRSGGPWLFGGFSIADCMYTPVVLRFITYSVELHGESAAYRDHVVTNPGLQRWLAAAQAETEVLTEDETGTPETTGVKV